MKLKKDCFPSNVKLISTQRFVDGGRSSENFANFNLALHVNDSKDDVIQNRNILRDRFDLPSEPVWINQTHSSICIEAESSNVNIEADASYTSKPGIVCGVLTADCLPVFVSNKNGTMVGIAHAGWRGLVSGVIENLIRSFNFKGEDLFVHLGPAISKKSFEVGEEVMRLYLNKNIINCFYFADSFGSMTPDMTKEISKLVHKYWKGDFGIHAHDNCGLALKNTLEAMKNGAKFLDCTF